MCELDAVISDLHNIGAFAQEYHRKPTTMEGGDIHLLVGQYLQVL